MKKTAPPRIRAGVTFTLQTATDAGHCGLPTQTLNELAQKLLEVDALLIEGPSRRYCMATTFLPTLCGVSSASSSLACTGPSGLSPSA